MPRLCNFGPQAAFGRDCSLPCHMGPGENHFKSAGAELPFSVFAAAT
jgi:hypothetical protein